MPFDAQLAIVRYSAQRSSADSSYAGNSYTSFTISNSTKGTSTSYSTSSFPTNVNPITDRKVICNEGDSVAFSYSNSAVNWNGWFKVWVQMTSI